MQLLTIDDRYTGFINSLIIKNFEISFTKINIVDIQNNKQKYKIRDFIIQYDKP